MVVGWFGSLGLQTQLPAGGVNVVALFTAQGCHRPMLAQDGQEPLLPGARWARPLEAFDRVVRNQIHFGAQPPRVTREQVRLLFGVVNSCDQNIFKVDALLLPARVVIAGVEQTR